MQSAYPRTPTRTGNMIGYNHKHCLLVCLQAQREILEQAAKRAERHLFPHLLQWYLPRTRYQSPPSGPTLDQTDLDARTAAKSKAKTKEPLYINYPFVQHIFSDQDSRFSDLFKSVWRIPRMLSWSEQCQWNYQTPRVLFFFWCLILFKKNVWVLSQWHRLIKERCYS